MLQYIPNAQSKLISDIEKAHNGYGYSTLATGFYSEPILFNNNHMLLVRKNFYSNFENDYYRDVYVDYFGGVYIFDQDNRFTAHDVAEQGYEGLQSLVFSENSNRTGYYFSTRNEEYLYFSHIKLARYSQLQLEEKIGPIIRQCSIEEACEFSEFKIQGIDKRISEFNLANSFQPQMNSMEKADRIAKSNNIIGSFITKNGGGYGPNCTTLDPFSNEMMVFRSQENEIKLFFVPCIDTENSTISFE
jgi:hypothetical protein